MAFQISRKRKRARAPEYSWKYLNTFSPDEELKVPEETVQRCLVEYLRECYPRARFNANVASNVKLGWRKATLQKKAGNEKDWPDIFIASPRHGYHGFFIELKRAFKNGRIPKSSHVENQALYMDDLEESGYYCCFALGFKEAKRIVDDWMSDRPQNITPKSEK